MVWNKKYARRHEGAKARRHEGTKARRHDVFRVFPFAPSRFRAFVQSTILLLMFIGLTSCSIRYGFVGGTMDYSKVKSISIKDFPNMAPLVYPQLAQKFTEQLREKYIRQTRLQVLRDNGTMSLEGEITGYELTPLAVREDMYASQTRLTVTIRVRFTNQVTPEDDFEQSFSAYQEFDNSRPIESVQEELTDFIIKEIIDQIYNATVAKW